MIELIRPTDSIDIIEEKISQSDALWLDDHYPTPVIELSNKSVTKFEKFFSDNPKKKFFIHNCTEFENGKKYDNVIWLPSWSIRYSMWLDKHKGKFPVEYLSPRHTNLVFIGGQTRINRTLANFWLGSNIDKSLLKFTNFKNNNIAQLVPLITKSKMRKLPKLNRQLGDNFERVPDTWQTYDTFFHVLLPKYFQKSNIALITEANGYELSAGLTEKTLHAFYSGCFPLWLGNYRIDSYIKKLGFELFDFFDYSHLHTTNRADLTLQGLENNKILFKENETLNDFRSTYKKELKHNFVMSTNYEYQFKIFQHEFKMFFDFVDEREKLCVEKSNSWLNNGTISKSFYNLVKKFILESK